MFRLHLFIKKQAHTARKGSVGLNNNVAQIGCVDKVVDKSEVFRYSVFSTCAIQRKEQTDEYHTGTAKA